MGRDTLSGPDSSYPILIMALTHYIIVRRDLPLGVVCAQVTHAAGESFGRWACGRSTYDVWQSGTTAVVLGVGTQRRLLNLEKKLKRHHVPHVAVREPDAPWNGQLMAIGLYPTHRELVSPILDKFATIQTLDAGVADRNMHGSSKPE